MIVEGELKEGDSLPNEAALIELFGVSRPTLREAVRVLESEGLVVLRRGSRTGARVTVPGPEAVARPAALQLQLGGATLADVYVARSAIEPPAAGLLARSGDEERYDALEAALQQVRESVGDTERFAVASAVFHLRLVELSGNRTLAIMAGLMYEIILRQTQSAVRASARTASHDDVEELNDRAVRAYAKLLGMVRRGKGDQAETFWRKHLQVTEGMILQGHEATRVIDVLD
jgi:DNA-binding FadR family transcriptional regulator